MSLREAQLRLELARREQDLQQQTLELTYQRYSAGAVPLFPVGAANAELELLRSQIAEAEADNAVFKDRSRSSSGVRRAAWTICWRRRRLFPCRLPPSP
ncbi:MAG: hypothetical protein AB1942_07870 [Pseudomonadota bacterium]